MHIRNYVQFLSFSPISHSSFHRFVINIIVTTKYFENGIGSKFQDILFNVHHINAIPARVHNKRIFLNDKTKRTGKKKVPVDITKR